MTSCKQRRQWPTPAAGVGLALLVVSCGSGATGGAGASNGSVTLRATEFKFDPGAIHLQANTPVRMVLVNAGQIEHDVTIEGISAKNVRLSDGKSAGAQPVVTAPAGKQVWMEFTPTAKGTFVVVCTIAGHKDAGMRGTVTVE